MSEFQQIPVIDYQIAKKVYSSILIISFLWVLLIFLAPLFTEMGGVFGKIASVIYLFFSKVCHQSDQRSFHFLGHRLGVCSRCVWIYSGFFTGSVLYRFKYRIDNIIPPSVWFLLIALAALVTDVMLDVSGIVKNTFFSRSVTGFIVGIALPFYIIPGFVKFFYEVFSFLRNKISI